MLDASRQEAFGMPMNRVQFQRGLSMAEFVRSFGSEADCQAALLAARWPRGFVCPACNSQRYSYFERGNERLWQCSACRKQTSLLAGTVFEHTKLPLRTWFVALYLLTQTKSNVSALELTHHLGVCYRTAWRMKHKLMEAMASREATRKLGGLVQIDDAYLGGELQGGTAGRGSENKRPFVAAVSTTDDGHPRFVALDPVPSFSKAAITEWASKRLAPQTDVFSDGLGCFRAVVDLDHAHTVLRCDNPRARCDATGAKWVNTVLGNVKRALDGTYHCFDFFKYSHRYLAEAAWRFNRRFDLSALLRRLLHAAAACPPRPERVLRDVPAFGS